MTRETFSSFPITRSEPCPPMGRALTCRRLGGFLRIDYKSLRYILNVEIGGRNERRDQTVVGDDSVTPHQEGSADNADALP